MGIVMGLYDGMRENDIHARKGLQHEEKILDHMVSEELAALIFRATQADAKLQRDQVGTKGHALAYILLILLRANLNILAEPLQGCLPIREPLARLSSSAVPGARSAHKLNRHLAHHLQCHI